MCGCVCVCVCVCVVSCLQLQTEGEGGKANTQGEPEGLCWPSHWGLPSIGPCAARCPG